MAQNLVLNIYFEDKFLEYDIKEFKKDYLTIGRDKSNNIFIDHPAILNKHAVLQYENGKWEILSEPSQNVKFFLVNRFRQQGFDCNRYFIGNVSSIKIGREKSSDIIISDNQISRKHAEIKSDITGKFSITDLDSTNGIYVNGIRVKNTLLNDGDIICLFGYKIIINKEYLDIFDVGNSVFIKLKTLADNRNTLFKRSPRLHPEMPSGEINIPRPPSKALKPTMSIVATIAPVAIMSLVTIGAASFTNYGKSSLLLTLPMMGASVLVSYFNYGSQKRAFNKNEKARVDKYKEVINNLRIEIEKMYDTQRNGLLMVNPPPIECIKHCKDTTRRLWERTFKDNDFLSVRLGIGNDNFAVKVNFLKEEINIEEDSLIEEAKSMAKEFKEVKEVPICLSLEKNNIFGIVGEEVFKSSIIRNTLIQLCTHHSPDEVKIVGIFSKTNSDKWDWIKWLPHIWDDEHKIRFIGSDEESIKSLCRGLYDLLNKRKLQNRNNTSSEKQRYLPHIVFLIEDMSLIEKEAIASMLVQNDGQIGVSSIFLSKRFEQLPKDCSAFAYKEKDKCYLKYLLLSNEIKEFALDEISLDMADYFSRCLAPLKPQKLSFSNEIPDKVTLLDLFGAEVVEELDVIGRWKTTETFNTMEVPIGLKAGGEKFLFDIKDGDRAHGPHGLVAGATGSGKSELIQSLIASLAINFHPHDVAFVLVDYKGGGMANIFKSLPHLVGTITNLQGNQIMRALSAIKSEKERREHLFAQYEVKHIDEYQRLYKKKQVAIPLPHLIIVIDEFAELKMEQPDFMSELVSTVRVGRSLGIHLILATQKPAGVVDDQIWSNTRFRICLKVERPEDSRDVIKHPDAASLTKAGRAYIQVGNDEIFELFQGAWSGAAYNPGLVVTCEGKKISAVELNGVRRYFSTGSAYKVKKNETEAYNQLSAVIDYMSETAKQKGIYKLEGPWLPPLPEAIYLDTLIKELNYGGYNGSTWVKCSKWMQPIIGMVDNPTKQQQKPAIYDINTEGNLILYGAPGSGKTTFLQTLITSLAKTHCPQEVNMYILDFGGRTLKLFEKLPHVGGVVMPDDSEKVNRLIQLINKEIKNRKYVFAQNGVSTLKAYIETTGNLMSQIILILDGYNSFVDMYTDLEEELVQIAREGSNLGINIIFTANSYSSVKVKMTSNMPYGIALELTDKSDYSIIVGKTNGLEPDKVKGRGLLKGNPPLEFQTALTCEGNNEFERTSKIKDLIESMSNNWRGEGAKHIPTLSDLIPLCNLIDLDENSSALKNKSITVGVNSDTLENGLINLSEFSHLLVTGPRQSGKSTFMRTLTMSMVNKLTPDELQIYIIDSFNMELVSLKELPHVKEYIIDDSKIRETISEIQNSINLRRQQLNEARLESGGIISVQEFISRYPEIVIVIDDFESFNQMVPADVKDTLEKMVRKERGMGLHIVMGALSNDVYSSWEGFMKAFKELQSGVLLGSSEHENIQLFNLKLPVGESGKILPPGLGYFANRGVYFKLKVASTEVGGLTVIPWAEKIKEKYLSGR